MEEFLADCSYELRSVFFDAMSLLDMGQSLAMPLSRNLANIYHGLHELRLRDRTGQVRIFYFIKKGEAIYLLHAFKKKTQELPRKEIEVTLNRIREI
ncbi:MAG: type II toxin-antitoxin system RelE/ParE family toxin [Deltaproteobacteria bacterium]|nr:type II toxin-antitoxin system RelE/ParE family toxin [Deltaproteobacteria bacterium]